MSKALLCIFAGLIPALVLSQAPTPSWSPPPSPAPLTTIQDVPVPVPREVLATLDKFAHSNWGAVQQRQLSRWKPHGEQEEIALRLGVSIAEGFVAVEMQDTTEVRD